MPKQRQVDARAQGGHVASEYTQPGTLPWQLGLTDAGGANKLEFGRALHTHFLGRVVSGAAYSTYLGTYLGR